MVLPEVQVFPVPRDPVVDRTIGRLAFGAWQAAAILLKGNDEMQPAGLSGLAFQAAEGLRM